MNSVDRAAARKNASDRAAHSPARQSQPGEAALWLAVRLTQLPLESLGLSREQQADCVVADKGKIWGLGPNLRNGGIGLGEASASVQLFFGQALRIYPRQAAAEQKNLHALCDALYTLTPYIEVHSVATPCATRDQGLLLELSRCLKLFKGFNPLLAKIRQVLRASGLSYIFGQAHSKQAAWLLSYREQNQRGNTNGAYGKAQYLAQLNALALHYLYQFPQQVDSLHKSGFFTLGDVIQHIEQQGMASLRQRLGDDFCDYLAATLDLDSSVAQGDLFHRQLLKAPRPLYLPQQQFSESCEFDYPIANSALLKTPLQHLLQRLGAYLVQHQLQTQCIHWQLYDIAQRQHSLTVKLERLYQDTSLALELTLIQLESQSLPFAVDRLELACSELLANQPHNHRLALDNSPVYNNRALSLTAAKIRARLGEHAMLQLHEKDSHIPELSFALAPVREDAAPPAPAPPAAPQQGPRPGWIFSTPSAIGKRQNALNWHGPLQIVQGPERIEGHWWQKPTARDYYIAQRDDHVRLWIFFDTHKDAWFVHGVFA